MKYGEMQKTWIVNLDGSEHVLHMELNMFRNESKYFLNKKLIKVVRGQGIGIVKNKYTLATFNIEQHKGFFQFRPMGRVHYYELFIDGKKIEGVENSNLSTPPWAIALLVIACVAVYWLSVQT
jgi:hypothetical protein